MFIKDNHRLITRFDCSVSVRDYTQFDSYVGRFTRFFESSRVRHRGSPISPLNPRRPSVASVSRAKAYEKVAYHWVNVISTDTDCIGSRRLSTRGNLFLVCTGESRICIERALRRSLVTFNLDKFSISLTLRSDCRENVTRQTFGKISMFLNHFSKRPYLSTVLKKERQNYRKDSGVEV